MHPVRILASFALVAALSGGAFAAPPAGSGVPVSPRPAAVHRAKGAKDDVRPARVARPAGVSSVDNTKFVDINNIKMFVTNTGSFAYDKGTGNAGLEFPNGTGNTAVFAAGLWIGAQVGGLTRMAVSEYSDEYGPGSAAGGVPDDPNKPEYKVYKLDRVYTDLSARDAALADYNAGAVPHGCSRRDIPSLNKRLRPCRFLKNRNRLH